MKEKIKEYFEKFKKTGAKYNVRVYNSEGTHICTFKEMQEDEMLAVVAFETSCLDMQCLVERAAPEREEEEGADD